MEFIFVGSHIVNVDKNAMVWKLTRCDRSYGLRSKIAISRDVSPRAFCFNYNGAGLSFVNRSLGLFDVHFNFGT